jgi:hypothetical protein
LSGVPTEAIERGRIGKGARGYRLSRGYVRVERDRRSDSDAGSKAHAAEPQEKRGVEHNETAVGIDLDRGGHVPIGECREVDLRGGPVAGRQREYLCGTGAPGVTGVPLEVDDPVRVLVEEERLVAE